MHTPRSTFSQLKQSSRTHSPTNWLLLRSKFISERHALGRFHTFGRLPDSLLLLSEKRFSLVKTFLEAQLLGSDPVNLHYTCAAIRGSTRASKQSVVHKQILKASTGRLAAAETAITSTHLLPSRLMFLAAVSQPRLALSVPEMFRFARSLQVPQLDVCLQDDPLPPAWSSRAAESRTPWWRALTEPQLASPLPQSTGY